MADEEIPKTAPLRKRGRPRKNPAVPLHKNAQGIDELRLNLLDKSEALDLLADVAAGRQIRCAGPTGKLTHKHPTLSERLKASELILKRILPELQAQALLAHTVTDADIGLTQEVQQIGAAPGVIGLDRIDCHPKRLPIRLNDPLNTLKGLGVRCKWYDRHSNYFKLRGSARRRRAFLLLYRNHNLIPIPSSSYPYSPVVLYCRQAYCLAARLIWTL